MNKHLPLTGMAEEYSEKQGSNKNLEGHLSILNTNTE